MGSLSVSCMLSFLILVIWDAESIRSLRGRLCSDVPEPNEGYIEIAMGTHHCLGLKADGSIEAWGDNTYGLGSVSNSLNEDYISMTAGEAFCAGLKSNGTVVIWPSRYESALVQHEEVRAVSAGRHHILYLLSDGSVVARGRNDHGQCDVPEPNGGFIAVAAGEQHSLGLLEGGIVVAWGDNESGQCDVPEPNTGFVAIDARAKHSLALRADGSLAAWGTLSGRRYTAPEPNTDFIGISCGSTFDAAVRFDGSIAVWGAHFRSGKNPGT